LGKTNTEQGEQTLPANAFAGDGLPDVRRWIQIVQDFGVVGKKSSSCWLVLIVLLEVWVWPSLVWPVPLHAEQMQIQERRSDLR
jgi:hypothetical protein